MRAFIAIEVPGEIRTRISQYQNTLKKARSFVSWVKPDNVHVTLKFLGEIKEETLPGIEQGVKKTAEQFSPFEIEVLGAGGFPSLRRPRVLWVGLAEGAAKLQAMAGMIDDEMQKIGFEKEEKHFTPHLTIGRVKSQAHIEQVTKIMETDRFSGGSFTAREIIVMRSDLKPTGAVYTPLKKVALGSFISPGLEEKT